MRARIIVLAVWGATGLLARQQIALQPDEAAASRNSGPTASQAAFPEPPVAHDVNHCAADANGDLLVDIFDLTLFANWAFAPSPPPYLDIRPNGGDGVVDVTGDISFVAGHFTDGCIGSYSTYDSAADWQSATSFLPPATQPRVWACTYYVNGWVKQEHIDRNLHQFTMFNWGGWSGCATNAFVVTECTFDVNGFYDSGGGVYNEVAAGISPEFQIGGPACYGDGYPLTYGCNLQLVGHVTRSVRLNGDGTYIYPVTRENPVSWSAAMALSC